MRKQGFYACRKMLNGADYPEFWLGAKLFAGRLAVIGLSVGLAGLSNSSMASVDTVFSLRRHYCAATALAR
jgi:hypothetical protein